MITITIERTTTEQYVETKNFIVKSTPTEIRDEDSYGNRKSVKCVEEYQTKDIPATRTTTTQLLKQQIPDESTFDLAAVIKAVNGL